MNQKRNRKERRISIRGIRRRPPDLRKLASALLLLAQSEIDAEAGHERRQARRGDKQNEQDTPAGDSS